MVDRACSQPDCETPRRARGWCLRHYTRWRRHGDPLCRLPGEVRDGRKVCGVCSVDLPVSEFGRLKDPCRRCAAAIRRLQRNVLRAEDPAYWRKWNNPEQSRVRQAEWRRANPDKVRATCAARRALTQGAFVEVVSPATLFKRDHWTCGLCGAGIDPGVTYPDLMSASIDHVIPLARGGLHSYANTQAAHLLCNLRKYVGASELVAV